MSDPRARRAPRSGRAPHAPRRLLAYEDVPWLVRAWVDERMLEVGPRLVDAEAEPRMRWPLDLDAWAALSHAERVEHAHRNLRLRRFHELRRRGIAAPRGAR